MRKTVLKAMPRIMEYTVKSEEAAKQLENRRAFVFGAIQVVVAEKDGVPDWCVIMHPSRYPTFPELEYFFSQAFPNYTAMVSVVTDGFKVAAKFYEKDKEPSA